MGWLSYSSIDRNKFDQGRILKWKDRFRQYIPTSVRLLFIIPWLLSMYHIRLLVIWQVSMLLADLRLLLSNLLWIYYITYYNIEIILSIVQMFCIFTKLGSQYGVTEYLSLCTKLRLLLIHTRTNIKADGVRFGNVHEIIDRHSGPHKIKYIFKLYLKVQIDIHWVCNDWSYVIIKEIQELQFRVSTWQKSLPMDKYGRQLLLNHLDLYSHGWGTAVSELKRRWWWR